jgi:hypothetical protein
VTQNAGASRVGAVVIAGNRFEVTQSSTLGPPPPAPGCTYTLLPVSAQVVAAGGDGSVSLTTGGECTWVAISSEPWLAVTSETSGTGSAEIDYRVTANDSGAIRTGHITVGTATFTVEQVAAGAPPPPECTFTVTPSDTITAEAGGSTGTISVATTGSCEWSATASVPWIVLSASGERGPGQVAYTIEPNTLASERTGTITVAGTTIAVRQGTGEGITLSGLAENVAGSCPVLTFTLEGRSVTTSDATAYLGGGCGKLKSGGAIRVRGVLTPEGTVDASEIEFTR